tara:strand:+ start:153 stop:1145 length:993 start_codon:yes stop_codon:yes gene_type:complete
MEKIAKYIEEARNIKPNSINAYLINIKKVYQGLTGDYDPNALSSAEDLNFLKDEEGVIDWLQDKALTTKKNYLTGIITTLNSIPDIPNGMGEYTDSLKFYRSKLEEYTEQYNNIIDTNEKTEKQAKNWSSIKDLKKVLNSYKNDLLERGAFSKSELSKKQFDILQKYVIGSLYVYEDNPPARLSYGSMKIINNEEYNELTNEELAEHNYIINKSRNSKFFHFGDYKTSKSYGIKKIPVGKKLNSILNIWFKYNKSDNFLIDSRGGIMTSNQLSKYLNKVFEPTGKKISANMLRHIFISENFPVKTELKKAVIADRMFHSVKTQSQYSKIL